MYLALVGVGCGFGRCLIVNEKHGTYDQYQVATMESRVGQAVCQKVELSFSRGCQETFWRPRTGQASPSGFWQVATWPGCAAAEGASVYEVPL